MASREDQYHDARQQEADEAEDERRDPCPFRDMLTDDRCVRERGHKPFHELADGTTFGIGYTDADAAEWST